MTSDLVARRVVPSRYPQSHQALQLQALWHKRPVSLGQPSSTQGFIYPVIRCLRASIFISKRYDSEQPRRRGVYKCSHIYPVAANAGNAGGTRRHPARPAASRATTALNLPARLPSRGERRAARPQPPALAPAADGSRQKPRGSCSLPRAPDPRTAGAGRASAPSPGRRGELRSGRRGLQRRGDAALRRSPWERGGGDSAAGAACWGAGSPAAAWPASPGGTYREDSPLKLPPSSSRTLQKRMPLTKGTEESSSSSSSTRNLNFFFFIMMKAMGRGLPGGRPHARSAPRGSSPPRPPPRSAPMPRQDGTERRGRSQLSRRRPRRRPGSAYMAAGASLSNPPASAPPAAGNGWRRGAAAGGGRSPAPPGPGRCRGKRLERRRVVSRRSEETAGAVCKVV